MLRGMRRRPWRGVRAGVLALGLLAAMSMPASVNSTRVNAETVTPARTVKVMTWNVCSGNNTRCRFYHEPGALVGTVRRLMLNYGVPTDAAILQEFCASFARPLEDELEAHSGRGWDVRFVPIKVKRGGDATRAPDFKCDRGRGSYGIALAVPDENTWWDARYLPSPEREEWRVAMCATVESWRLKLCNTHLSYGGDDPNQAFRARQIPALLAFVGSPASQYRVVFGGDLNLPPNSAHIASAYAGFVECAQQTQGSPRTGSGTSYATRPYNNAKTAKIDYLFTNPDLVHTCTVPGEIVESSDHRPLWITVRLPSSAGRGGRVIAGD
jgi:endonuclease/exonuclease/phosphatase family metal-dependent hydrolase